MKQKKSKENKYRKAVFIVIYKKEKKKVIYLILKRKLHWKGWEFTKGGIEKNETPMQCAIREIKEETNLTPKIIQMHNYSGKYNYDLKSKKDRKPYIGQSFILFSAQIKGKKIKLDSIEHEDYKWENFKEALEMLTWVNQKNSLKIVNKSID
jgi:tRNA nucleotidyltransferase (CCA-adding enzyme)